MTLKRKNIVKLMVLVVAVMALCLTGCGGNATLGSIEEANGPAIGVSPSLKIVKLGETFDVAVLVKTPEPISAAGCQLKWSGSGKIEATGKITEGDFFKKTGKTLMVGGGYDPAVGTTQQIAVTLIAGEDDEVKGAKGEGTLVVFHFKALERGEVILQVFDVQLVDMLQKVIESKSYDGKVVVE